VNAEKPTKPFQLRHELSDLSEILDEAADRLSYLYEFLRNNPRCQTIVPPKYIPGTKFDKVDPRKRHKHTEYKPTPDGTESGDLMNGPSDRPSGPSETIPKPTRDPQTGRTPKEQITEDGKVGIGTSPPPYDIDLNTKVGIGSPDPASEINIVTPTDSADATTLEINTEGNVGPGTTEPDAVLRITETKNTDAGIGTTPELLCPVHGKTSAYITLQGKDRKVTLCIDCLIEKALKHFPELT
jgi:hypothetical protein